MSVRTRKSPTSGEGVKEKKENENKKTELESSSGALWPLLAVNCLTS